jgi:hypothetical protein
MNSLLKWSILSLGLVTFLGCGPGGKYDTIPATVKVTYKGQPVEGANVTLVNTALDPPAVAVGRTDAQGVTKLRTEDQDGITKGTHLVTINKYEAQSTAAVADQESESYDPNVQVKPPKNFLPQKYATPASGLTIQAGDAEVNQTFDLVD